MHQDEFILDYGDILPCDFFFHILYSFQYVNLYLLFDLKLRFPNAMFKKKAKFGVFLLVREKLFLQLASVNLFQTFIVCSKQVGDLK